MERKVIESYSEMEIEEAFLAAFDEKAKFNYINSYDIDVARDYDDGQKIKISVQIGSMAGAPTKEEFGDVEGMESFEITFGTGAKTTVILDEVLDINTMEYHAIYVEGELSEDDDAEDDTEEVDTSVLSGSSEIEE